MNTKMDIVYPIAGGVQGRKSIGSRWDNNELRYSLRSMEKNFPNIGQIFIVGYKPDWLTNVVHIPVADTHRRNKDANLIDKVLAACAAGVSDTFIRLSDDQCLLQPWDGGEAYHAGNADVERDGRWWQRMQKTCAYLKVLGRPTFFYDTHSPQPINREEFKRVMEAADYAPPPGMCINTLYHNSVDIPRVPIGHKKVSFHGPATPERLRKETKGRLFLGYAEPGTNDAMKEFLQELFPAPSRFELPGYEAAVPAPGTAAQQHTRTKRQGTPPSLTPDAIDAFLRVLPPGCTVFELGSGKSTSTFRATGRRVVTVEHQVAWLNRCPEATYVHAPMEGVFYNRAQFIEGIGLALERADLGGVVVDGPPKKHGAHRAALADYLPLLRGVPFLVDDINRRSERRLVRIMENRGWVQGEAGETGGKKWVIMLPAERNG